ncbi:uncharacterized protein LOC117786321 [Drosophila innubila]|uniref:uncharacterized protein LOC117786321 n=1 Tax=Drosophila innubila TaxID=198719 RepID=UPI00148CF9B8|nr:uncharacterized protein LOC117786321 [Drosophila innubila]
MYKVALLLAFGLFAAVYAVPSTYDNEYTWVTGNLSITVPANAVIGGFDPYGYYTYIGRVIYSTNILPARVVAEKGIAYFNTDTVSYRLVNYQLLLAEDNVSFEWIRSFDGYQERNAVSVGTTHWNENVYMCRAKADGGLLVGTLFLSRKVCIIKNEDLPLRQFDKYEILVARSKINGTVC